MFTNNFCFAEENDYIVNCYVMYGNISQNVVAMMVSLFSLIIIDMY